MTATDRRFGVYGAAAVKVPCRCATLNAITLAGLQTIGDVTVVDGDRVLVKDQTDAVDNGIYVASTGPWLRSSDFNGPYDIAEGTLVYVVANDLYELTTETPVIGTSELTFARVLARILTNGDLLDGDLSTAAGFTAALDAAFTVVGAQGGGAIDIPPGEYEIEATAMYPNAEFTVTIASPAVVSQIGHGLVENTPYVPVTDGALPTGLTAGTIYYVEPINANQFYLLVSPSGSRVNTTGSQSGIHKGIVLVAVPSTDEGYGIKLTAGRSNITVRCNGTATIRPTTNRIEMFWIDGAENTIFEESIKFDNAPNGVLQNELKPARKIPGAGVVGLGNAANCAIRQSSGENLTVSGGGTEFHTVVDYIGDWLDTAEVYGTVDVTNMVFDGCVFGLLVNRAKIIRFTNSRYDNGVNGINAAGSPNTIDLGAGIYVADRTSAEPWEVVLNNIHGHNNFGHITKVRKGLICTASNISTLNSHRGVQFENIHQISGGNIAVKLADINPDDMKPDAVRLVNFGNAEMTGFVADISGCNANAFRINGSITDDEDDDDDGFPDTDDLWRNRRATLNNLKVIDDGSASHDKPWFVISAQKDLRINHATVHLTGDDFSRTDPMFALEEGCERVTLNLPTRDAREALNPTDSDKIVRISADCDECTIILDRTCLFVDPTADTIQDSGSTNLKVRWLDEGAPRIYTSNFTVTHYNNRFINDKIGADQVVTLPDATLNTGRILSFTNRRAFNIISASSDVAAIADGVVGTLIVSDTAGKWAEIQSDGTQWVIIKAG